MLKRHELPFVAPISADALTIGLAASAQAAPSRDSLVTVQIGDVMVLVPVAVAANL